MNIQLYPSTKAGKKYTVEFYGIAPGSIKIHFGDSNYSDYTQHHDKERRDRYILRHQAREDWRNYRTPGFWSRWVLWNQPNIYDSLKEVSQYLNAPINLRNGRSPREIRTIF